MIKSAGADHAGFMQSVDGSIAATWLGRGRMTRPIRLRTGRPQMGKTGSEPLGAHFSPLGRCPKA